MEAYRPVCSQINRSVTLRDEYGLTMFENRILRKYLVPRKSKYQEAGEKCIMRSFISCKTALHKIWCSNHGG
jgi:hypothetical protein